MKILVVQTGRIGDAILTTPMFAALKEAFPEAALHALASPRGLAVFSADPRLSKVLVRHRGLPGLMLAALKARQERYDLWIDPKDHPSSESSFLARSSGARRKVGFNGGGKVFDLSIPSDQENFQLHAVERNLLALQAIGIPAASPRRPDLFPDARATAGVEAALAAGKAPLAVVNISAGQPSREWDDLGWAGLAGYLKGRGFRVALAFQPGDESRAQGIGRSQPSVLVIPSPTVHTAMALVRRARLVVTVDTSVVHMASAFDTPVVALYPGVEWNTRKFAPLSTLRRVLVSPEAGSLAGIPLEAVRDKAAEVIEEGGLLEV